MGSSNHGIPDGDPYDEGPSNDAAPRRRWPWAAAVVALAVAAVAGGVAVAGNMVSADPARSTTGVVAPTATGAMTSTPSAAVATSVAVQPSATSAPATSDAATPPPAPGVWRTFSSDDGKVSFDYPGAWSVSTPAGAAGSGEVDVDVSDEAGLVVASLHLGPAGGFGGACQGAVPYSVLDSVEVALPYQPSKGSVTPRFAFRALQESDRVTASYGLTSTPAGQGGTTCMFYNMVNGPAETPTYTFADAFQVRAGDPEEIPGRKGAKAFPSMDAARAYMETSEYLNAKRMITSLKLSAG
ncbi:hypothetical protein AB4Y67_08240 [Arthrobacter sp. YAF17]|uniref:hypothetical protein n=1 Tax=Arthrobacter sp. YAF17 TaxID=3233077 RepID=UPI003F93E025